jgi:hypothetical protein
VVITATPLPPTPTPQPTATPSLPCSPAPLRMPARTAIA